MMRNRRPFFPPRKAPAVEAAHRGMGTEMTHWADGGRAQEALRAVQAEAGRLEDLLSRYRPGSDIARLNHSAGAGPVAVGPEAWAVLRQALAFAELTGGLFDPTVGPLVDLWDFRHARVAPDPGQVARALTLVGYRDLVLQDGPPAAMLRRPGQSVDLGGIAKGYVSDRFMEIFAACGVRSAWSNLGGNVSTLGRRPDGSPWRVGIRHPRGPGVLAAVEVTGRAVVTSGDYERYFIDPEGRRRHHLLHPATGAPAESGLVSATVVADSAMTADALSTALFVAGVDGARGLLSRVAGAEAVLVDEHLTVWATGGIRKHLETSAGIPVRTL